MSINIKDKQKHQLEMAAEQWVNIVFAHLQHKKQFLTKKNKNNYGK